MKRSIALIALIASSAFGGFTLQAAPAAAAVTYICTSGEDCTACRSMHPESTCQKALAQLPGDKAARLVIPNAPSASSAGNSKVELPSTGARSSASSKAQDIFDRWGEF